MGRGGLTCPATSTKTVRATLKLPPAVVLMDFVLPLQIGGSTLLDFVRAQSESVPYGADRGHGCERVQWQRLTLAISFFNAAARACFSGRGRPRRFARNPADKRGDLDRSWQSFQRSRVTNITSKLTVFGQDEAESRNQSPQAAGQVIVAIWTDKAVSRSSQSSGREGP